MTGKDIMANISVLYRASDTLAASYTLYPLLQSDAVRRLKFFQTVSGLKGDRNRHLLMVGWFRDTKVPTRRETAWLEQLRQQYATVVYLDCNDGTEIQRAAYMRYFDLWFVKQAFCDRRDYEKNYPGQRFYTPFYIERFGVSDGDQTQEWSTAVAVGDIPKIRTCWNILIGAYPLQRINARCAAFLLNARLPFFARRFVRVPRLRKIPIPNLPKCHARFDYHVYRPTVGFQRRLFLSAVQNSPHFLVGTVPHRQYCQELRSVQAVLSPFGWGEVCFRDAEAVIAGATLIKPDMRHVDTWPNIYVPNETYIPVKWDSADVVERTEEVLATSGKQRQLRANAIDVLASAYRELPHKVEGFLEAIVSGR